MIAGVLLNSALVKSGFSGLIKYNICLVFVLLLLHKLEEVETMHANYGDPSHHHYQKAIKNVYFQRLNTCLKQWRTSVNLVLL